MFLTFRNRGDIQTPAFVLGWGAQVREKQPLGIQQDTTVTKKCSWKNTSCTFG